MLHYDVRKIVAKNPARTRTDEYGWHSRFFHETNLIAEIYKVTGVSHGNSEFVHHSGICEIL